MQLIRWFNWNSAFLKVIQLSKENYNKNNCKSRVDNIWVIFKILLTGGKIKIMTWQQPFTPKVREQKQSSQKGLAEQIKRPQNFTKNSMNA